jgi:hypothetical protein
MKINQKHIEKPKCRKGEAKKRGKNKNTIWANCKTEVREGK